MANAILGEWPQLKRFSLANNFPGHGFEQAAAEGRHMSELIIASETSMDLSVCGTQPVMESKPISVNAIV